MLASGVDRRANERRRTDAARRAPRIDWRRSRLRAEPGELATRLLLHIGQGAHFAGNLRQLRIRPVDLALVGDPDDSDQDAERADPGGRRDAPPVDAVALFDGLKCVFRLLRGRDGDRHQLFQILVGVGPGGQRHRLNLR
jgi:hypothetical protein